MSRSMLQQRRPLRPCFDLPKNLKSFFLPPNPPSSLFFSPWEVILILLATHTQASLCEQGDGNNFPPDDNWQGCNLSMGRWLEVIKQSLVWFTRLTSHDMDSSVQPHKSGLFFSAFILISALLQQVPFFFVCSCTRPSCSSWMQSNASAGPYISVPVLAELCDPRRGLYCSVATEMNTKSLLGNCPVFCLFPFEAVVHATPSRLVFPGGIKGVSFIYPSKVTLNNHESHLRDIQVYTVSRAASGQTLPKLAFCPHSLWNRAGTPLSSGLSIYTNTQEALRLTLQK